MSAHSKERSCTATALAVRAPSPVSAWRCPARSHSASAAAGPAAADPPGSASVTDGTLSIVGSSAGEALALRLAAGDPTTLQVDFGDDGIAEHSFDRSTFSAIEVLLRSGDDRFRVDQVGGAFADEVLTVDGGQGDDTLLGGDGNELFLGGPGNDSVDGNRGADTAELAQGNDSFRWDPGDGSDVVEGGPNFDTLDFNGNNTPEIMSLSAEGDRAVFLRDQGNIRMDMDRVERLDLTTLGAADTVTIGDMTGTDFRRADIDLSLLGAGDAANDVVSVLGTDGADRIDVVRDGDQVAVEGLQVTTKISGGELDDLLAIHSGDGDDDVVVDPTVPAVIAVAVDLGPGEA